MKHFSCKYYISIAVIRKLQIEVHGLCPTIYSPIEKKSQKLYKYNTNQSNRRETIPCEASNDIHS